MQPSASATIVVATDLAGGIGIRNTLPWHLPADLAHFKRLTSGHTILMGRKTFESIGRPLPNRRNIVITRDSGWQRAGVEVAHSLSAGLQLAGADQLFVIGGAQIYAEALPQVSRLVVTEIGQHFECDAHFPPIDPGQWRETAREPHRAEEGGFDYAFVTYERIR